MRSTVQKLILSFIFIFLLALLLNVPSPQKVAAQQATGSVPTVTGTPYGAYVKVIYEDQINVRAGPSQYSYSVIGVMLPGEIAPAVGISPGKTWVQISYPGVENGLGWVFYSYVDVIYAGDTLPIVEPPPTPTPQTTATINPVVAAALITDLPPTRIPTYTPPGPLQVPTYTSSSVTQASIGPVPMGFIIVLLTLIGGFGALISFLRGR